MSSHLLHLATELFLFVARLPWALVEYIRGWLHFRRLANRFPGPPAKPLVGNLLDLGFPNMLSGMNAIMEDVMRRYPVGQIWIGPVRFVLLNNVNDIEVFLKNSNNQSKPDVMVYIITELIGKSSLSLNGEQWRLHNKTVLPTFHQNRLNSYVSIFNGRSDVMIQNLLDFADGSAIDVKPITEHLIMYIVNETLLGIPSSLQTNRIQEILDLIEQGKMHMAHRLPRPWLYHPAVYKLTPAGRQALKVEERRKKYLEEIIEQRVNLLRYRSENFENKGSFMGTLDPRGCIENGDSKIKYRTSVIDSLLQEETKSTLPHEEVVDEMQAMVLGSLETAGPVFMFALYYLGNNPIVQEKALRELEDIFEAAGSTEVTPETLNRMQYLDMIVKETLRMRSPVPIFVRAAGVDTPLASCDLVVPAGATVMISPQAVHMDPELYPDPHVFDPERFSQENCSKRHPFAFIPFSGGTHYCIGNKFGVTMVKTMISKIIWNFRILPDESFEPQLVWALTMGTENGMKIKLLRR